MASHNLLCKECGKRHLPAGTRKVLEATAEEPAEYQRLTWGRAKTPTIDQRIAYINGEPFPMDPGQYECDSCNGVILPGQECAAWTVWSAEEKQPHPVWELDFLVEVAN